MSHRTARGARNARRRTHAERRSDTTFTAEQRRRQRRRLRRLRRGSSPPPERRPPPSPHAPPPRIEIDSLFDGPNAERSRSKSGSASDGTRGRPAAEARRAEQGGRKHRRDTLRIAAAAVQFVAQNCAHSTRAVAAEALLDPPITRLAAPRSTRRAASWPPPPSPPASGRRAPPRARRRRLAAHRAYTERPRSADALREPPDLPNYNGRPTRARRLLADRPALR